MTAVYSKRALDDLREISRYIEQVSPRGARSVMRRIEATITLIDRHPGVGRAARQRRGVRLIPVGRYPYRIYFRPPIDTQPLMILHIRHTSRRAPQRAELAGDDAG